MFSVSAYKQMMSFDTIRVRKSSFYTCDRYRTISDRTFHVLGKRNSDTVGSFSCRETNKDGGVFQHESAEPVGDCTKLTGLIVEIGDKQRFQQAGHHQGEAKREENICRETKKAREMGFHLQT